MDILSLLSKFQRDGLVVLPALFSEDKLDSHCNTVAEIREKYDVKDQNGFGDRIGQLHQKDPELMDLICNPVLQNFLSLALEDDPLLFGSLNFEKGTQQNLHVDAIFFWPEPSHSMCGVWIALEDVDMDNGPLMYVPGSHKWEMIRGEDVVSDNPIYFDKRSKARAGELPQDEKNRLVPEMGKLWTEKFLKLMDEKKSLPITVPLKKGDVVVWHSLLAHGGSVINDKYRSRKSVVYHFLGKKSLLFSFDNFMLLNNNEFTENNSEKTTTAVYKNINYIRYPYFVTYNNGKQEIHHLDNE